MLGEDRSPHVEPQTLLLDFEAVDTRDSAHRGAITCPLWKPDRSRCEHPDGGGGA